MLKNSYASQNNFIADWNKLGFFFLYFTNDLFIFLIFGKKIKFYTVINFIRLKAAVLAKLKFFININKFGFLIYLLVILLSI